MTSETTRTKDRAKGRGKTQGKAPVTTGSGPQPQQQVSLVYRYGTIGIEAVAAAARYTERPKAAAPVAPRIDPRFLETAV
jgi:hypothetical protein